MGRDMIPQQVQRYYPPSPGSSSPQLSCKAVLSGLLSRAGSEFIRACNIETDGLHDEHFIHQQLLARTRCSLADCRLAMSTPFLRTATSAPRHIAAIVRDYFFNDDWGIRVIVYDCTRVSPRWIAGNPRRTDGMAREESSAWTIPTTPP
jgi:hypothetical protein